MKKIISLIVLLSLTVSFGQNRYKITAKEKELKSTTGNQGVYSVFERTYEYNYSSKQIEEYWNRSLQFNDSGLLENYVEETSKVKHVYNYRYENIDKFMTYTYRFYDKGEKTRDVTQKFKLYKNNIGYAAEKVGDNNTKFYADGKIKEVTSYNYSDAADYVYTYTYNGSKVSEIKALGTIRYDDKGRETYSNYLFSNYNYYGDSGYMQEEVSYTLGEPEYTYFDYKLDMQGNWVSKTEYRYNEYSFKWELKKIYLREITYNNGSSNGSTNLTDNLRSQFNSKAAQISKPYKDPEGKLSNKNSDIKTANSPKSAQTNNTKIEPKKTTGCISGDCQNGWGRWNYNNGYYSGFWNNGKRHGYGLYDWTDAGNYIGFWENDSRNGYGVYFYNEKDEMSGEFKNGELNGFGKNYKDGKWSQGIYKNATLQTAYTFYNNKVTTGCVAGDCQNKYGRYKWSNGDQFTGFFSNGNMYMGTYVFANGDKYSGMFNAQNQFHGGGRFFFDSGEYYGGDWQYGKYNGKGYYQDKDKNPQQGRWSNGLIVEKM